MVDLNTTQSTDDSQDQSAENAPVDPLPADDHGGAETTTTTTTHTTTTRRVTTTQDGDTTTTTTTTQTTTTTTQTTTATTHDSTTMTGPHSSSASQRGPNNTERREIAQTTLATIDHGSFELDGQIYDLRPTIDALIEGTTYYPPNSELGEWATEPENEDGSPRPPRDTKFTIVQCSTLEGCDGMRKELEQVSGEDVDRRIGVLNFASAKKPGGGFLTGSQAQEETIARSSTLYASLMLDNAQEFYTLHHHIPKDGFYTHAMIYSPRVHLFRHDSGAFHAPFEVDVLTSPAVNAGDVRRKNPDGGQKIEWEIEAQMTERMGRLLYLFEKRGIKNLVLGSFGTGVFQNSVELVAKLWVELLVDPSARFRHSFDRVVFAIIDTPTVSKFREVFSELGVGAPTESEPQREDVIMEEAAPASEGTQP